MGRSATATFTEQEFEQIDRVMTAAANRGEGFSTLSELMRHATLTYVDFVDRMQAGQLDGLLSAELLVETVPGIARGANGAAPKRQEASDELRLPAGEWR